MNHTIRSNISYGAGATGRIVAYETATLKITGLNMLYFLSTEGLSQDQISIVGDRLPICSEQSLILDHFRRDWVTKIPTPVRIFGTVCTSVPDAG